MQRPAEQKATDKAVITVAGGGRGDDEMMTLPAVLTFFGGDRPIHYSTLYRGIAAGRYPKPVRVGPNTSRWLRSECLAARQALIDARDSDVA